MGIEIRGMRRWVIEGGTGIETKIQRISVPEGNITWDGLRLARPMR